MIEFINQHPFLCFIAFWLFLETFADIIESIIKRNQK